VIEQARVVRAAAGLGAEALVIECMALQPYLQALSESRLIRATHAVITNARADHLEVMGPTEDDVAWALAATVPPYGRVFSAEVFGRKLVFVNGFAANDPESTERLWRLALDSFSGADRRIAIFNCRADRPERSRQLGLACARWPAADRYVLIGSGTAPFAEA